MRTTITQDDVLLDEPEEAPSTLQRIRKWGNPVVTTVVILGLWEAFCRLFAIKAYLLPPPSLVFVELGERWPRILDGAWITSIEIIVGFVIAAVISVPMALAVAFSPWIERHVYPAIVTFTIIPKIAIAPLFIIWFGFGLSPKLLLVFLLSFFPMLVNNIAGFRSLNAEVVDFGRSTGASMLTLFLKIRLPSSLPYVFTGLKVGSTNAATAAVVAEFVASDSGLGYLLLEYNGDLETAAMFATIVVLSAVGLALYYFVEFAERVAIPWHVSQQRHEKAAAG